MEERGSRRSKNANNYRIDALTTPLLSVIRSLGSLTLHAVDCPRITEQRSDRKQRTTMSNYFVSFGRESHARSESSRATRSYFDRADRYARSLHD